MFEQEVPIAGRRWPVWAVGVALALALVLFVWWRSRKRASEETAVTDPMVSYDEAVNYDYGTSGNYGLTSGPIGDYLANDPTNPAFPVGIGSNGLPSPITNVQWTRLAFDELVASGGDPNLIQRALAKYINGLSLTSAEQGVVNLALTKKGAPPEGLILTPEDPLPTPVQTPPPPPPSSPTSTRPMLPGSLTVPANTDLYTWSQNVEGTYAGIPGPIIDIIKPQGPLRWKVEGVYTEDNKMPYFTRDTTVYF